MKILKILLILCIITGCQINQGKVTQTDKETKYQNTIEQDGINGKISISINDDWNYQLIDNKEELLGGLYGIQFSPKSVSKGYIEIAYVENFGVCGTGEKIEEKVIANETAEIITYDNHSYFDYIYFLEHYKGIVVYTYQVDDWWDEYKEQVMDIIDTLSFNGM
jgi:hypothetical protein